MEKLMEVRFLNVDLEIESSEDLQPIIDDFGESVSVLYHGENGSGFNLASFEVYPSGARDIDGIIAEFCLYIENLSPEAKEIWDKCFSKRFDAGFQSGDFPRSYKTEIRADIVERVAKVGASIVVTIYPEPAENL
jgi:hypothetical protein